MSYTKREWATGNVVGAVDLNRMEQGIEDAGSSGSGEVLVVNAISSDDSYILDKTWQEIYDAFPNVYINVSQQKNLILSVSSTNYTVGTMLIDYIATSANDYPTSSIPK